MTFFPEASEIIIHLLLLPPLMLESCPIFASIIKISVTHKVLTFKTTISSTAKPLQLISSLFKIYICI